MTEDADIHPQATDATGASVEDSELLRRYAETGAEAAFAELVRRRIGLVYAVALRHTRGDRHRAEDATQAVFTDLARKAHALARRPVLAGWLYRSAQFAAAGLMRAEQRRLVREQEAHAMEKISAADEPVPDWEKVRPVLDEALNEMDERDRDAILLRYFDGRPFAEIGGRLQLTENAARMRVERALDKLHAALARRGLTSTAAALGAVLGSQVGAAAPAGLAASVTGAALAQTAAGAGGWLAAFMGMSKLQVGIAGAIALAGAAGYVRQTKANADLSREIAALQPPSQAITALRAENERLARVAAEVELLRRDDGELAQLAQRVAEVKQANAERIRLAQSQAAARDSEERIRAEVERMNREGNKLVQEYKALTEQAKSPAAGAEARALAAAAAQEKLEAIKAKQREVQAYIATMRGVAPAVQTGTIELRRVAPAAPTAESGGSLTLEPGPRR